MLVIWAWQRIIWFTSVFISQLHLQWQERRVVFVGAENVEQPRWFCSWWSGTLAVFRLVLQPWSQTQREHEPHPVLWPTPRVANFWWARLRSVRTVLSACHSRSEQRISFQPDTVWNFAVFIFFHFLWQCQLEFFLQAVVNPENTFYSVKRFVGRQPNEVEEELKEVSYKVDFEGQKVKIDCPVMSKKFAPEEVSAQVLRKLSADAGKYLSATVQKAGALSVIWVYLTNMPVAVFVDWSLANRPVGRVT